MLEKYKLCPCCGKKNYPGLIECIDCEQDLTQVAITDSTATEADGGATDRPLVRLCDACFAKNPPNARKCLLCGEDISDILPTPDAQGGAVEPRPKGNATVDTVDTADALDTADTVETVDTETTDAVDTDDTVDTAVVDTLPVTALNTEAKGLPFTVVLVSEDRSFRYTVTQERTLIGRSEEMGDYLAAKPYVSRVHCAITVSDEGIFLEDLNNTNYSFVNNTRAVGRVRLENGDSLSLGGLLVGGKRQTGAAYFTVTVI